MKTGRAHQSLRDSRAIEKPEAVTCHSEESQRTNLCFTDSVPFFPWIVEGTSFASGGWSLLSKVVFRRTRDQKLMSIQSNSFYFFSEEDKNWQLDQTKKRNTAHLSEKTAEKSMEEDEAPACKAHPPVLINGSRSVKGRDNNYFLFHWENTMSCIHVLEKATTEQDSLLPWPAAEVHVGQYVDHEWTWSWLSFDRLFFFQFLPLRLNLFVLLSTFVAAYIVVCSWLICSECNDVQPGHSFYSKWPFGPSQHISKKSNLSHWWTVHFWVEWSRSKKARAKLVRSANAQAGQLVEKCFDRMRGHLARRKVVGGIKISCYFLSFWPGKLFL